MHESFLQLGVAQSALSHHISQMEARLGVALFSRSSKGCGANRKRRWNYRDDHASAILAAVDAATNDVRDNSKEPGGLVRLGATLTIAPVLIEPLMARLSETAPRVSLRIEERLSPQLVQAVASGELDVAVCFNVGDDRRIDGTQVFEEDICLVGVPELVGDTDEAISLEEALPLLLPGRDHILRGMIDRVALFRNRPINVRQDVFHYMHYMLGSALANRGYAYTVTRSGDVMLCHPISEPVVSLATFYCVCPKGQKQLHKRLWSVRDLESLPLEICQVRGSPCIVEKRPLEALMYVAVAALNRANGTNVCWLMR